MKKRGEMMRQKDNFIEVSCIVRGCPFVKLVNVKQADNYRYVCRQHQDDNDPRRNQRKIK